MEKIKNALFLSLIFIAVYILVDCSNCLSAHGLKIENINTDLLTITASGLTAFLVFYCTYHLVEQWDVRKNQNISKLAQELFRKSLRDCETYYNLLDGRLLNYVVEKCDREQQFLGNSPADKYSKIPFENEEMLIQCALQGAVAPEIIMKYYELKNSFSSYCLRKALFYEDEDVKNYVKPAGDEFQRLLKEANKLLDDSNNEVN